MCAVGARSRGIWKASWLEDLFGDMGGVSEMSTFTGSDE